MTVSTYQRLREQVAKDAGLPRAAAETFHGETVEIVAQEAVEYARTRRGEAGVRDVLKGFAEADLRESPDDLRARVSRDLNLSPELRGKLSAATRTESEVVDDALSLLRVHGGQAALDAGVRKLQSRAMTGLIQERRGTERVFAPDDMNGALRAAAGRDV